MTAGCFRHICLALLLTGAGAALAGPIEELFAAIGCERATLDETLKAYDAGRCDVFTSDASQLYAIRVKLARAKAWKRPAWWSKSFALWLNCRCLVVISF